MEGLRIDAEDDLIWICDAADDLYAGDVDDWYQNQITEYIRGNRVDGLIAKTPTTLPVTPMTEIKNDKFDPAVIFAKKGSKKAVDDEEEMEGEDDEEMPCTGKGCKCDKCKPKGKKRMDEQDLAQTIEQVVADRLDAAEKIRNDEETRTAMVDRITVKTEGAMRAFVAVLMTLPETEESDCRALARRILELREQGPPRDVMVPPFSVALPGCLEVLPKNVDACFSKASDVPRVADYDRCLAASP